MHRGREREGGDKWKWASEGKRESPHTPLSSSFKELCGSEREEKTEIQSLVHSHSLRQHFPSSSQLLLNTEVCLSFVFIQINFKNEHIMHLFRFFSSSHCCFSLSRSEFRSGLSCRLSLSRREAQTIRSEHFVFVCFVCSWAQWDAEHCCC